MPRGATRNYTPARLEEEVQAYFALCRHTEEETAKSRQCSKPPTMEGLATHLKLSRRTLQRYRAGDYPGTKAEKQQVLDCLERATDYLTAETLEGALLGRYDPRICTMILQEMGYGAKEGQAPPVLQVEWKGVPAESLQRWSE